MSFSDLPLPSKIVCLCHENELKCEKHAPDRRLLNWKKWTEERKRTNKTLARALDRHSEQLLMNYGEDIRTINEERTVIENTNIIYPHDHYRGNPSFWRVPVALRKQLHQPDYFSVMTSAQKCEIPSMEYIKVPNAIRHEKDSITTGYRNEKQIWDRSEYRKHKIEKLKDRIEIVEPFKPDLDNLFIKGVGIATTHAECYGRAISPPDTMSLVSTPGHVMLPIDIHADENYLMMNNLRLCNHTSNDVHVYLSFEYDIGSKQVLTKTVKLTNGTPYALRYCFVTKRKFNLFRDIVEDKEEQVFFYNKRELILLPKDNFQFSISMKTDFAFTHRQQLLLQLRPNLWNHTFVINLLGIATYNGLSDKCANIKQRMEAETCKVVARDLVQDMLKDVRLQDEKDQLTTFYIYDKPTIFQVVNQKFTPVTRHPKYIYNKDIVEELENFYLRIRLPDAPASWDLNIENLREITRKRQHLNYRKAFVEELLNVKNGQEKKDANIKSATALKAKGSVASKSTLTKPLIKSKSVISRPEEHKTFGNNLMEELEEILLKLQQFTMWFNENRTLYESCYTVICIAFDTILEEVYRIEVDFNIRKIDKYPEQFTYNPHVFEGRIEETHYDLPGQPPRINEDFMADAKPAAECLKDIPLEDSKARYNTYYGIVDNGADAKTKAKGKKGPKEKPKKDINDKKSKGAEKKGKNQEKPVTRTESIDVDLKENPNFNIDAEPIIPEDLSKVSLKQSLSSEDDSSDVTSGLLLKEYKRSLYEVFYRNMLEAAVKLVDIIELHKHEAIRAENIKRMIEEASVKQPPVQVRIVDLKEAIRVAMDIPKKYRALYSDLPEKRDQTDAPFDESVHKKEEGSEWSILRPLQGPEPITKPISHPDTNVYLKKKNSRRLFKEVGTIMSNAGIDPNWQDFKDVGVQIITKWESRPEKEEFISTIINDVVGEACCDAEDEIVEEESETKSSEILFCCDEIPALPNRSTQNTNNNEKKL